MKLSTQTIVIVSMIAGIGIVAAVFLMSPKSTKGDELIPFAECLKDNGALFYGAFWCPHCQAQKALFGTAAKSLPYIECSTPDANGQLPVCDAKGIKSYPTWYFADGSNHVGELSLAELSAKTSCPLPGDEGSATSTPAQTISTSTSSQLPGATIDFGVPVTN